MRWILGNWELKLVSLVVALALWSYTSGQVRVERQVLVEITPAQIAGLPAALHVEKGLVELYAGVVDSDHTRCGFAQISIITEEKLRFHGSIDRASCGV